jgi:DNA-directed RNA polymerase alpha subunit
MPPEFEMLSVRTKNVLRNGGIESVEGLSRYTIKDMLKFRQCGTKTVEELSALLDLHQLQFNS